MFIKCFNIVSYNFWSSFVIKGPGSIFSWFFGSYKNVPTNIAIHPETEISHFWIIKTQKTISKNTLKNKNIQKAAYVFLALLDPASAPLKRLMPKSSWNSFHIQTPKVKGFTDVRNYFLRFPSFKAHGMGVSTLFCLVSLFLLLFFSSLTWFGPPVGVEMTWLGPGPGPGSIYHSKRIPYEFAQQLTL